MESKRVFSFRSEDAEVKAWRLQAKVRGVTVNQLGEAAMREYIENHPLSEDEAAMMELFQKREADNEG